MPRNNLVSLFRRLTFLTPPLSFTTITSSGESLRPCQHRRKFLPMRPKPFMATFNLATVSPLTGADPTVYSWTRNMLMPYPIRPNPPQLVWFVYLHTHKDVCITSFTRHKLGNSPINKKDYCRISYIFVPIHKFNFKYRKPHFCRTCRNTMYYHTIELPVRSHM